MKCREIQSAPLIAVSTEDGRRNYLRQRFKCIGDCEQCGNCRIFHGQDIEIALDDYVKGRAELNALLIELRERTMI